MITPVIAKERMAFIGLKSLAIESFELLVRVYHERANEKLTNNLAPSHEKLAYSQIKVNNSIYCNLMLNSKLPWSVTDFW